MGIQQPLFNSKLMKIYLEYIAETYPHIDISPVFEYSNISPLEINESGHWFDESRRWTGFINILLKRPVIKIWQEMWGGMLFLPV